MTLRARLHGKRVPLGDMGTAYLLGLKIPSFYMQSSNMVGAPSLAGSRDSAILHELNFPYLGEAKLKGN